MADLNPRFELHFDQMDETYSIHRVEVIGPFKSRDDARDYMRNRSNGAESDEAVSLLAEIYDQSGAGGDLAERVSAFLTARER